ncbi:ligase-associated DNA damage response DEXH box helicase [Azoarcus olearius]|uniref:Probable ATP-dependent helicase n=1 Tax=Azoarcus sp. (strain BH72) TaxID=418699 RepID=A1K2K7_AZOSB|nr:ligase-associated DNA damage response DEXH box helicase [Azoarcus olearius]CAL93062.1 probable ATP-dependent helicase [Azoarcus olearius]
MSPPRKPPSRRATPRPPGSLPRLAPRRGAAAAARARAAAIEAVDAARAAAAGAGVAEPTVECAPLPGCEPGSSLPMAARIERWYAARGWAPFDFQRALATAVAAGESGLLHATTGAGKTYAAWFAALARWAAAGAPSPSGTRRGPPAPPLTLLWLTPMRALAADTGRALQAPLAELGCDWRVGVRSGDTAASERAAQDRRLPTALVTTPESLSLLLSRAEAAQTLGAVAIVVVDEWHELLGNKRGVQVQLALARLRRWNPALVVWGLSATLGNLDHARAALLGPAHAAQGRLLRGEVPKQLQIDTLLPSAPARFPWAGHLGMQMLPQVVAEIDASATALVFVNTRSQAELWYQALLDARPDWAGLLALHHGSLDADSRAWVEAGLKAGTLKAVVCTSSLDLGVDFLPVERVLQIGSPKGVARLLQRAGRSGHAPGRPSRVTLVPTQSLELVEAAAARAAAEAGHVEARRSPEQPMDVLVQHLVTVALGGGFRPDALLAEVRGCHAYRALDEAAWQWALDFVGRGGAALVAYPDYRRVAPDEGGVWRVPDARLARRHRMGIGTIVSDAGISVRYWGGRGAAGGRLGTVEESFVARLRPGDCFLFAGRLLELVRVHEMTAWVRRASGARPAVPRWNGGRMPLSSELAAAVVAALDDAADGRFDAPELERARPLLELQARWSALPRRGALLAETLKTREGHHLFLYPFAGRAVHLGLASLFAWRLARTRPLSFSIAVNDYGLTLLCAEDPDWDAALGAGLFEAGDLLGDVLASLNAGELARRRFREIARVSGLVFTGYPGEARSTRQLQASAGLFYEVFRNHDPANLLLDQAEQEVLRQELELGRLEAALAAMRAARLLRAPLRRPSPFAFPLLVERMREKLSTEKLADRIRRMLDELERAADAPAVSRAAPSAAREG